MNFGEIKKGKVESMFIEVTETASINTNDEKTLINISCIQSVYYDYDEDEVFIVPIGCNDCDYYWHVKESYEEVRTKIQEAMKAMSGN